MAFLYVEIFFVAAVEVETRKNTVRSIMIFPSFCKS